MKHSGPDHRRDVAARVARLPMLPRNKPQPGSEVSAAPEVGHLRRKGLDRQRRQRPDPWHRLQPTCCVGLAATPRTACPRLLQHVARHSPRRAEMSRRRLGRKVVLSRLGLRDGSTAVPSPPPLAHAKAFSPFDHGRIFRCFQELCGRGCSPAPASEGPEAFSPGRYSPDLFTSGPKVNRSKRLTNGFFFRVL
jgi:hypothetical protein